MKINILNAVIISFTHETHSVPYNYYVGDLIIIHTVYVKDVSIFIVMLTTYILISYVKSW
jgi:hypothetical protein